MLRLFPSYRKFSPLTNFVFLATILLTSYIAVWFFEAHPLVAAGIIALPGILFLLYAQSAKLLAVTLLAALAGTAHEVFFIQEGYWWYREASFLGIPAYLPVIWANIGILSVAIYKGILIIDRKKYLLHILPPFPKALGLTVSAILASLFGIFFLAPHPFWLMAFFLIIDILYVYWMRSIPLALVGILALGAGSTADLIAVPLGIWQYPMSTASFLGVPLYIFIGWDVVGILLAGLYITFDLLDTPVTETR